MRYTSDKLGTTMGDTLTMFNMFSNISVVNEQADIGADHSKGNHSIQDISIRRSSSVVQDLRKERDFIGQLWVGNNSNMQR